MELVSIELRESLVTITFNLSLKGMYTIPGVVWVRSSESIQRIYDYSFHCMANVYYSEDSEKRARRELTFACIRQEQVCNIITHTQIVRSIESYVNVEVCALILKVMQEYPITSRYTMVDHNAVRCKFMGSCDVHNYLKQLLIPRDPCTEKHFCPTCLIVKCERNKPLCAYCVYILNKFHDRFALIRMVFNKFDMPTELVPYTFCASLWSHELLW